MKFAEWLTENLGEEYMEDLANHGAESGFPGLTYYKDTVKLYYEFEDKIWERLYDDAESLGQTPLELIASLNGAKDVANDTQFKNLLVWYLAEEVARELTEQRD